MKKINFNFKDIAYLTQYASVDITDEMVENTLSIWLIVTKMN